MPIRVLMVGPYPRYLSQIDGGVAAATTYLSQALSNETEVELIGVRVVGRTKARDRGEELGWPVEDLELGRFSISTLFWRQHRRFRSLLSAFKPDVVHAQGADVAGYLAVKSGYPAVVTIHGILTECARLRTDPVMRLREYAQARITEQFVVERSAHIIAISPYVARHYKERLLGEIHQIPNAVAPAYFEVQRKPETGRLLFAGRISQGKGVLELVRLAAGQPEIVRNLILAGAVSDKAFESRLLATIAESGCADRVTLTGLLDEPRLLSEFARASALVLPSYQETAPMVVQQAMAAGLPVIATRVGGIPDMIDHDSTGLLFEAGDVLELGRLLLRLHDDPSLGPRLAEPARRLALASYTAKNVSSATKRAYEKMLSRG